MVNRKSQEKIRVMLDANVLIAGTICHRFFFVRKCAGQVMSWRKSAVVTGKTLMDRIFLGIFQEAQ